MLATAPAVVSRRQKIDNTNAGKFALAATANANPTKHRRIRRPERDRPTPPPPRRTPATRTAPPCSCSPSDTSPLLEHVHPQIMRQRARARERQPRDHRQDRRKRHRRDEAEHRLAAELTPASIGAPMLNAGSTAAISFWPTSTIAPKPRHKRQQVEIRDQPRRVERAFARLHGIGHGVKTHQDVRQPGRADHQRQPEADVVERLVIVGPSTLMPVSPPRRCTGIAGVIIHLPPLARRG